MTDNISRLTIQNRLIFAFCLITAIIPMFSVNMPRSYAFIPCITATLIYAGLYFFGAQKPKISIKAAIIVGSILSVATLSLIWAKYFDVSKDKVVTLFALLPPQILLISLATSLSKEQLAPAQKFLPIGFLAAAFFLCFEILTHGVVHDIVRGRPISFITDPDDFNRGCVTMALYAFAIFAIASLHIRKIYAFLIIFIPLGCILYLTESLAAQLAGIVGLFFLFAFPYRSKISWALLKIIILGLMFAAPFFISDVYDNFAQSLQQYPILAHGYAGHRLEVWDYVSRYMMNSPFFGYGIEMTRATKDFDSKLIFWHENFILHPHNFVIQIWVEFGLFGITVAIALMYMLLTSIEKYYTIAGQKILLPTLMATLVPLACAYGLWQGLWIGLIFHAAAIALIAATLTKEQNDA